MGYGEVCKKDSGFIRAQEKGSEGALRVECHSRVLEIKAFLEC